MSNSCDLHFQYFKCLSSSRRVERLRRLQLSRALQQTLDRVNVLGDEGSYGHTGCVNALSWARNGELLLSGGDDTTVRIWGVDPADTSQDYPFVCRSVIQTGHTANIFSAHMLPYSSRIATVAGDYQIRVFDIGEAALTASANGKGTIYSPRQSLIHRLRCHDDRVKRVVTEHSPDLFLTVGEDGTVRQHDLRASHNCWHEPCPSPLVKVNHQLSTLSLSPLTPHLFVVAGESPFGYLFDRRHVGRNLRTEWGMPYSLDTDDSSLTTCVRRFGKPTAPTGESQRRRSEHITGARMSTTNGHEVILSFSNDGVYLYSTYDDPENEKNLEMSGPLSLEHERRSEKGKIPELQGYDSIDIDAESSSYREDNGPQFAEHEGGEGRQTNSTDQDDDMTDVDDDEYGEDYFNLWRGDERNYLLSVPVVLPRQRYSGARNVATIKDVNFLGPSDEFVASGSDDGNFFIWRKATGALHGIYEGDGTVVNMIEGHPHLPLVAVSGIDHTVKLFAPSSSPSNFSRLGNAAAIMQSNARPSRPYVPRSNFVMLLAQARSQLDGRSLQSVLGSTFLPFALRRQQFPNSRRTTSVSFEPLYSVHYQPIVNFSGFIQRRRL